MPILGSIEEDFFWLAAPSSYQCVSNLVLRNFQPKEVFFGCSSILFLDRPVAHTVSVFWRQVSRSCGRYKPAGRITEFDGDLRSCFFTGPHQSWPSVHHRRTHQWSWFLSPCAVQWFIVLSESSTWSDLACTWRNVFLAELSWHDHTSFYKGTSCIMEPWGTLTFHLAPCDTVFAVKSWLSSSRGSLVGESSCLSGISFFLLVLRYVETIQPSGSSWIPFQC